MKAVVLGLTAFMSLAAHASCTNPMNEFNPMNEINGGGICQGERVISDSGLVGTASAVFPSGDVMVKFDGYSSYNKWPVSKLGKTSGCATENICVESIVFSDNGLRGRVGAIYQDNQVAIKFDGYSTYNKWPISRLSKSEGCVKGRYCVGDSVISDNGLAGVIHGVSRELSKVMVKFSGYSTYNQWPTSKLGKTKGCTHDQYCVGDVIISDNGLKGRVTSIFKDGQVSVKFVGYSTHNKWPTHRLAITEPTNERPMNEFNDIEN